MSTVLSLPREIIQQILRQAEAGAPLEVCGLLGRGGQGAFRLYPVENELGSATRFRMAPQAMLDAFVEMEKRGETLFAIYHSHPNGPLMPSETDRLEDAYPEVVKLIAARQDGKWHLNGYQLEAGGYHKLPLMRA